MTETITNTHQFNATKSEVLTMRSLNVHKHAIKANERTIPYLFDYHPLGIGIQGLYRQLRENYENPRFTDCLKIMEGDIISFICRTKYDHLITNMRVIETKITRKNSDTWVEMRVERL